MKLSDLLMRANPPLPWSEADNIPWNEPGFSRRMLREHLSQEHDAASRRSGIIDQQVRWIDKAILKGDHSRILDLACGPGLYTERLARLGHPCWGIDYSPASIDFANSTAQRDQLACTYICQDLRSAEYPNEIGLVMFIYGEFNAFRINEAGLLLSKAYTALKPGGWLLLEPHLYSKVQELGQSPANWYTSPAGLFSDSAYIALQENFWDEENHAATTRYYVIDAASGSVSRYAHTLQAYTDDEYYALIAGNGFEDIKILPVIGDGDPQSGLMAITARRP